MIFNTTHFANHFCALPRRRRACVPAQSAKPNPNCLPAPRPTATLVIDVRPPVFEKTESNASAYSSSWHECATQYVATVRLFLLHVPTYDVRPFSRRMLLRFRTQFLLLNLGSECCYGSRAAAECRRCPIRRNVF